MASNGSGGHHITISNDQKADRGKKGYTEVSGTRGTGKENPTKGGGIHRSTKPTPQH